MLVQCVQSEIIDGEDEIIIKTSGRTEDGCSVMLNIKGFNPTVWVRLLDQENNYEKYTFF